MTELAELRALQSLATHGSFAKAARALGANTEALRDQIQRLELRLGVQLVHATGDAVRLTDDGHLFQRRTSNVLDELDSVEALWSRAAPIPRGKLRLSAPVVLGHRYLLPLIPELRKRHPELAIEFSLADRFVDLVHEDVDLAIRAGSAFDSRLVARRLCPNRRILVAAPEYLARFGTPQTPEELSTHECILFTPFANPEEWTLRGSGGIVKVPVSGMTSSNNGYVLNSLCEQGLGIAFGPTLSLAPALLSGRVVRVLPQYEMEETAVYAVYVGADPLPAKLRCAVEFFAEHLPDPPLWERELMGKVPGF